MVRKKEVVKPVAAKPLPQNNVTKNDTNLVTNFIETTVTNNDTKKVTKRVTENVTVTKNIIIGKKKITAKFTSDKKVRPNFNLSEETVKKIEEISEILGYKKAEFLDIYLNGTLEKLLKDLRK